MRPGLISQALVLCLVGRAVLPAAGVAQRPAAPPATAAPYTMHVYTNLLQVPTLVLAPDGHLVTQHLEPGDFTVHIQGMHALQPVHARQAGDEPLDFTLLVDLHDTSPDLLASLPHSADRLFKKFLNAADTVSVFAVDCSLVRTARNLPATAAALQTSVKRAQKAARQFPSVVPGHCLSQQGLPLLLEAALRDVPLRTGRPVLLLISDTAPEMRPGTVAHLIENFTATGAVLFTVSAQSAAINSAALMPTPTTSAKNTYLQLLTLDSGGIRLGATPETLTDTFAYVLKMVRSRYLLEFPRPAEATAGEHLISISIDKFGAHGLSSGVSAPAYDPVNTGTHEIYREPRVNTLGSVPSPDL